MSEITEHQLKITGSASFGHELAADKRLNITNGELEIYSVEKRDNQDGTFKLVNKARFVSAVDIEQAGNKIVSKNKGKKSQAMRMSFESYFDEVSEDVPCNDEKQFYDYMMIPLIQNPDLVYKLVKRIYEVRGDKELLPEQ